MFMTAEGFDILPDKIAANVVAVESSLQVKVSFLDRLTNLTF
jgi:hypothetical protein